jgi:hypothetical protein
MPQIGRGLRWRLLAILALALAACGRSAHKEIELSAAPVRHVVASLAKNDQWKPGKCLCVGHYRDEAVEDFPPGLLDAEFAKHRFLRKWSQCEPYYGRAAKAKGCEGGMTDFICSVAERSDLPSGTARVLCHVNGESEALQKAGYLQDEYDVTEENGSLVVKPVSLNGTGKIHE